MKNFPPRFRDPIQQIRNLTIATANFRHAARLAQFIIDKEIHNDLELYGSMMAGVVTTYTKNFTSSTKLGTYKADAELNNFSNPKMQKTHDLLLKSRNMMYAHQDAKKVISTKHTNLDSIDPFKIQVLIGEKGATYKPCLTTINPHLSDDIVELCNRQNRLVENRIAVHTQQIVKDPAIYTPGEILILGDSYPRIETEAEED